MSSGKEIAMAKSTIQTNKTVWNKKRKKCDKIWNIKINVTYTSGNEKLQSSQCERIKSITISHTHTHTHHSLMVKDDIAVDTHSQTYVNFLYKKKKKEEKKSKLSFLFSSMWKSAYKKKKNLMKTNTKRHAF